MAKITTGGSFGITRQQAVAVQLLVDGHSYDEVARCVFDVADETRTAPDPKKLARAKRQLAKWAKDPKVLECYRAVIGEAVLPMFGAALKKISAQIGDGNGWLANKAANDILTRFGPTIMGEEDKAVTVRVEGMPVMGMPGTDSEPDA